MTQISTETNLYLAGKFNVKIHQGPEFDCLLQAACFSIGEVF